MGLVDGSLQPKVRKLSAFVLAMADCNRHCIYNNIMYMQIFLSLFSRRDYFITVRTLFLDLGIYVPMYYY